MMSPTEFPPLPVVITMLSPLFKAVLRVLARISLSVEASNSPPEEKSTPPLSMITFQGSSSQVPLVPCTALVEALMPLMFRRCPEVSIKPPFPPCGPPCAERVP